MKKRNLNLWCVGAVLAFAYCHIATAKPCHTDVHTAYQVLKQQQKQAQQLAERLDINTATASDFASLKGVGIATAERIIRYRQQVGRFASVDELLNVKGVGQATLNKNRHRLSVLKP